MLHCNGYRPTIAEIETGVYPPDGGSRILGVLLLSTYLRRVYPPHCGKVERWRAWSFSGPAPVGKVTAFPPVPSAL